MFQFKEITGCDEQIFISTTASYSEGNNITTKNRCEGIKFTFKDINCTTKSHAIDYSSMQKYKILFY